MGIPQFQQYIKKTYSDSCKKTWAGIKYDNLYIDLNHVLHHVCYLAVNLNDLLDRFREYLRKIIESTKPVKRIYLAADGPAPMAKMMLQRKRRLDTVKTLDTDDDLDLKKNLNLNLTPGTYFMTKLETQLKSFITYIEKKYGVEVITSITDADEGEIKIRHQVQKFQKRYPDETHLVYSGDSDMILLLFTCINLTKVYQIIGKDIIIHFGTLMSQHREIFGSTDSTNHDFVFINLLMGNDYIPKMSLIKLESIWGAYKIVARNRPKGLVSIQDSTMKIDQLFIHDLLYLTTKKSPKHLMNRFSPTDLSDSCYKNYVEGLYWCFTMYTTGYCSNYRYIYDHRSTPPHVMGAMWTIMFNNTFTITKTDSIDVDLYGILLIPEKGRSLLSKEQNLIVEKLVKKHPIIYEEERCVKCKNFCKHMCKLHSQLKQYDSDSEERYDISKRMGKLGKSYNAHRETHEKMTAEKIDIISKSFDRIREKLRETVSLDSDDDDNKSISPRTYSPLVRSKVITLKKRLF